MCDRGSIPGREGKRICSLHYRVQTDPRAHSTSYPVDTGGKGGGEWSFSLCRG